VEFQLSTARDQLREAEDEVLRLQGQEKQHEILLNAITEAVESASLFLTDPTCMTVIIPI
jgi:hypothetical protein